MRTGLSESPQNWEVSLISQPARRAPRSRGPSAEVPEAGGQTCPPSHREARNSAGEASSTLPQRGEEPATQGSFPLLLTVGPGGLRLGSLGTGEACAGGPPMEVTCGEGGVGSEPQVAVLLKPSPPNSLMHPKASSLAPTLPPASRPPARWASHPSHYLQTRLLPSHLPGNGPHPRSASFPSPGPRAPGGAGASPGGTPCLSDHQPRPTHQAGLGSAALG